MNDKIKRVVDRTLVYYVIIGILNFIVCTALMFLLFNVCGFSDHVAPLFNYGIGSVIWYVSCRYLLFRDKQSTWQQLLRFLAEVIVCYVVSYYIIAPLIAKLLLPMKGVRDFFSFGGDRADMIKGNCEMTIGAIAYAILNYFGQRYFVFNRRFEHHRKTAQTTKE